VWSSECVHAKGHAEQIRLLYRDPRLKRLLELPVRLLLKHFVDLEIEYRNAERKRSAFPVGERALFTVFWRQQETLGQWWDRPNVASRFVRRLSPDLRRHVRRVLLSRALLIPAVLQAVAIALLLVAVVLPRDPRSFAAAAAAAAAAVARLYLFVYAQRRSRARRGLPHFLSRALRRHRAADATPDSEG
jgi:hypothetical protein